MLGDVLREYLEGAAHESDDTVGVAARSSTFNGAEAMAQTLHGLPVAQPTRQLDQILGNSGEPENTRTALPRALTGQVSGDPRCLRDATG